MGGSRALVEAKTTRRSKASVKKTLKKSGNSRGKVEETLGRKIETTFDIRPTL
jgi:hypothetical protein